MKPRAFNLDYSAKPDDKIIFSDSENHVILSNKDQPFMLKFSEKYVFFVLEMFVDCVFRFILVF
jgi:hypothetical protein